MESTCRPYASRLTDLLLRRERAARASKLKVQWEQNEQLDEQLDEQHLVGSAFGLALAKPRLTTAVKIQTSIVLRDPVRSGQHYSFELVRFFDIMSLQR